jgi:putative flippase GtrA
VVNQRAALLLDRARSDSAVKMMRYSAVSVVCVVVTQALLVIFHAFMGVSAAWSNVLAVSIAAAPAYWLNRAWVWGKRGRNHFTKEVLPFWAFAFAGLVISTVLVGWVSRHTTTIVWIMGANLAGFGVLWVLRYFALDKLMFGPHHHTPYDEDLEQELAASRGEAG